MTHSRVSTAENKSYFRLKILVIYKHARVKLHHYYSITEGITTLVCVNDWDELMAAARLLLRATASPGLGVRTGSGSTGGSVKLNLFFDMFMAAL